jgi:hypothetical protein
MNERIRELADYAGLITLEGNGFDRHALTPPEKEFARLVIEECVACAYWVGKFNTEPALPAATAKAFSLRIKTHFGVDDE